VRRITLPERLSAAGTAGTCCRQEWDLVHRQARVGILGAGNQSGPLLHREARAEQPVVPGSQSGAAWCAEEPELGSLVRRGAWKYSGRCAFRFVS